MLVAGMGGTILTLLGLAGIIRILNAIFPPGQKAEDRKSGKEDGL